MIKFGEVMFYYVKDLSKISCIAEETFREYPRKCKIKIIKLYGEWYVSEDNYKKFANAPIKV